MYCSFEIEKKSGGTRQIDAPVDELKQIQKKLGYILNLVYKVKDSAYGFIQNKNIKDNASNHTNRKVILNVDLKNFFSQINFGRIRGMLIKKPYEIGEEAANVIADIACFKKILPQGAPSSPIITNMICAPLDTQLIRLAKKYEIRYTRYVDDITFSTFKDKFSEEIIKGDIYSLKLGNELETVLNSNGFEVNDKKIFLNSREKRQEVTGLIVNKFPNIKREYIKNLRAILFNIEKDGIYKTAKIYIGKGNCRNKNIIKYLENENIITNWFIQVLKGKINYIREIRGEKNPIFLKYAQELNKVCNKKIFEIGSLNEKIENIVILTSYDGYRQGSGFYVKDIGLFTCYHVTEDDAFYKVTTKSKQFIDCISKSSNEIKSDKEIDYAVYKCNDAKFTGLELGVSSELNVGDSIIIIGFPDYLEGDTETIQTCEIINISRYMGAPIYNVSGKIIHGASGGVVLNMQYKVVGIIKAGDISMQEGDRKNNGFVPIDVVMEHFNNV